MSSTVFKIIMVYICIGVVLQAGGVSNKIADDLTGPDAQISSGVAGSLPDVNEETGSALAILAFIDSLGAVRDFLVFIGGVLIALPAVLLDVQVPYIVRLILGIPLTVAAVVAAVQFARSGN